MLIPNQIPENKRYFLKPTIFFYEFILFKVYFAVTQNQTNYLYLGHARRIVMLIVALFITVIELRVCVVCCGGTLHLADTVNSEMPDHRI